MLNTERLRIYPASREQMEAMIASEQEEELKKAYDAMPEGCPQHPDQWEWYAIWMFEKMDATWVGDLCFKGLQKNGAAEIGYGIPEAFLGQGYAAEAVQAACRWALGHAVHHVRKDAAPILLVAAVAADLPVLLLPLFQSQQLLPNTRRQGESTQAGRVFCPVCADDFILAVYPGVCYNVPDGDGTRPIRLALSGKLHRVQADGHLGLSHPGGRTISA